MDRIKKIIWGIPIGFINGFFASGGGVVAVLVLKKVLKIDTHNAHATALSIILPLSCASLFMYSAKQSVDIKTVLLCALGGCIGGALGAKFLGKIPKKWLKIGFGVVMVVSGLRMVIA